MWQQDSNPGERIAEEACSSGGFEFNDLQKFWNSLLGIATMGTNLVFAFLTTILAVSFTITGADSPLGSLALESPIGLLALESCQAVFSKSSN